MKENCFILMLLLCSGISYGSARKQACLPEDCRNYSGKIKVINNSGHDGIFSIWGDKCFEIKVKETINKVKEKDPDGENNLTYQTAQISSKVSSQKIPRACQETEIKDGKSWTFYIDKANVFGSSGLYVKTFFSRHGFWWWCINNQTDKYIGLRDFGGSYSSLAPDEKYVITFTKQYKTIYRSYYCSVEEI